MGKEANKGLNSSRTAVTQRADEDQGQIDMCWVTWLWRTRQTWYGGVRDWTHQGGLKADWAMT